MNYRFLLLLFFLFFSRFLAAQAPDTLEAFRLMKFSDSLYLAASGQFAKSLELARQSKNLYENALGKDAWQVGEAWYSMGLNADFLPNEHSQDYYYEAHRIFKKHLGETHPKTLTIKFNGDVLYCFQGNYEKCLPLLEETIQKLEANPKTPAGHLAWAYQYFGGFAKDVGDLDLAFVYLNKALELYSKSKRDFSNNASQILSDIALTFEKQERFEEAFQYHLKAFNFAFKNIPHRHPTYINALGNMAHAYANLEKPDSALLFIRPALESFVKNMGAKHPVLTPLFRLEGKIYLQKNQPDRAFQSWQKALEVARAPGNDQFHSLRFPLFLEIAQHFLTQKKFETALAWCDSVLVNSRFEVQNLEALRHHASAPGIAKALSLKILILEKWLETEDLSDRRLQFQNTKIAFETCLRELKKPSAEAVLDFVTQREVVAPATEATLDFAHFFEKNDEKRVIQQFAAAQFAKAEALSLGFQSNRVQHVAGLPDSILQNEKRLKKSLAELHAKLAEAEAKRDSAAAQKLVAEQFEKQRDFDRLQNFIKTSNPKFASLRSETRQPTLDEVRKKLLADRRTALLEYFVGERSIYIFRLTADGVRSWRVERAADFEKWVADFHRAVSDHELLSRDPDFSKKLFFENASRLSDLLLGEPLAELPSEISRLIFVPDGALHYLPFEALFANSNVVEVQNLDDVRRLAWRDFPFLIKKYAVSYGYSTGLLLEQNARPTSRPTRGFAGFAPKYDAKNLRADDTLAAPPLALLVRDGSYELPGAQGEVAAISKLVGGEVFQNDLASEANFRQRAGDFAVLHLAMHALVDDRNPALSRLLFSKTAADSAFDGRLTCGEIYALSLPADLAVLTACNSGFGKLGRGEGAMSLGRAFTFAGVRSTVMSLWQSPDAQTERLMVLFYQNLETGLPKDLALQKAKLECLASGENPALGHPFFWAGCVLNGNSQPLDLPNPDFQIWFLVGLLLLILVLMIGIFRHR